MGGKNRIIEQDVEIRFAAKKYRNIERRVMNLV
jgi:hypothetical protein